jgi:hypothetical protein
MTPNKQPKILVLNMLLLFLLASFPDIAELGACPEANFPI